MNVDKRQHTFDTGFFFLLAGMLLTMFECASVCESVCVFMSVAQAALTQDATSP